MKIKTCLVNQLVPGDVICVDNNLRGDRRLYVISVSFPGWLSESIGEMRSITAYSVWNMNRETNKFIKLDLATDVPVEVVSEEN
jgi:hypothetical protein